MWKSSKLLAGLAVVLSLCACKEDKSAVQNAAAKTTALPVNVLEVAAEDVPLSFEFSARAQGYKETEVRARVSGILLKKNYIEGSEVKEGDVLFEIDPKEYKAKLNNAKANLAKAKAQLRRAETEWARIEKLFKQRVVSEKSRDDAQAELEAQKAAVLMAESEVETAQLNFDYTKVTAPISGVTGMEVQSEGSLISATGLFHGGFRIFVRQHCFAAGRVGKHHGFDRDHSGRVGARRVAVCLLGGKGGEDRCGRSGR